MPVPSGKEGCASRATIDLLIAKRETTALPQKRPAEPQARGHWSVPEQPPRSR